MGCGCAKPRKAAGQPSRCLQKVLLLIYMQSMARPWVYVSWAGGQSGWTARKYINSMSSLVSIAKR